MRWTHCAGSSCLASPDAHWQFTQYERACQTFSEPPVRSDRYEWPRLAFDRNSPSQKTKNWVRWWNRHDPSVRPGQYNSAELADGSSSSPKYLVFKNIGLARPHQMPAGFDHLALDLKCLCVRLCVAHGPMPFGEIGLEDQWRDQSHPLGREMHKSSRFVVFQRSMCKTLLQPVDEVQRRCTGFNLLRGHLMRQLRQEWTEQDRFHLKALRA